MASFSSLELDDPKTPSQMENPASDPNREHVHDLQTPVDLIDPTSEPMSEIFFSPDTTFPTFETLVNMVTRYAEQEGFYIRRSSHTFAASVAKKLFNANANKKIVQRGTFYCNYKTKAAKHSRQVRTSCIQLEHDHPMETRYSRRPDGRRIVNLECDLTPPELRYILEMSPFMAVGKIREVLSKQAEDRDFSTPLVSRVAKKGRKNHILQTLHMQSALSTTEIDPEDGDIVKASEASILDMYNKLPCPKLPDQRFSILMDDFKKIAPQSCSNPHLYKLLRVYLLQFANAIRNANPEDEYQPNKQAVAPASPDRTGEMGLDIGEHSTRPHKRKRSIGRPTSESGDYLEDADLNEEVTQV